MSDVIRNIYIVRLPVGYHYTVLQDATKFPLTPLLSLSSSNCIHTFIRNIRTTRPLTMCIKIQYYNNTNKSKSSLDIAELRVLK